MDLPLIRQKMRLRITSEESQEMEEIRKYESLVITGERSITVIRNARQPILGALAGYWRFEMTVCEGSPSNLSLF